MQGVEDGSGGRKGDRLCVYARARDGQALCVCARTRLRVVVAAAVGAVLAEAAGVKRAVASVVLVVVLVLR